MHFGARFGAGIGARSVLKLLSFAVKEFIRHVCVGVSQCESGAFDAFGRSSGTKFTVDNNEAMEYTCVYKSGYLLL